MGQVVAFERLVAVKWSVILMLYLVRQHSTICGSSELSRGLIQIDAICDIKCRSVSLDDVLVESYAFRRALPAQPSLNLLGGGNFDR
jgi:hypothetical protein